MKCKSCSKDIYVPKMIAGLYHLSERCNDCWALENAKEKKPLRSQRYSTLPHEWEEFKKKNEVQ